MIAQSAEETGIARSSSMVRRALETVRRRFYRKHLRSKDGPFIYLGQNVPTITKIIALNRVSQPNPDEPVADFRIRVRFGNQERDCKLRVEEVGEIRRSNRQVEAMYNKDDLSVIVIVVRIGEQLARIMNRVYKAVCLIVSTMRREIDSWRRAGNEGTELAPRFHKAWKENRKHCYRYQVERFSQHSFRNA